MFKRVVMFLSIIVGLSFGFTIGPLIWESSGIDNRILNNPDLNGLIFVDRCGVLCRLFASLIEKGIKRLLEISNS